MATAASQVTPPPQPGAPKPSPAQAQHWTAAGTSGFEGREEELGRAIGVVLKTLNNTFPYPHELNDALVKAHLLMIQFAKNRNEMAALVAHDAQTMSPITRRMRGVVEKTGNRELALTAMFDHTPCMYQLMLDIRSEPGKRTWTSPYGRVLEASRPLKQFDLTEQEIHECYTKPRLLAYAADMGIQVKVSDWNPDRTVSCELIG